MRSDSNMIREAAFRRSSNGLFDMKRKESLCSKYCFHYVARKRKNMLHNLKRCFLRKWHSFSKVVLLGNDVATEGPSERVEQRDFLPENWEKIFYLNFTSGRRYSFIGFFLKMKFLFLWEKIHSFNRIG